MVRCPRRVPACAAPFSVCNSIKLDDPIDRPGRRAFRAWGWRIALAATGKNDGFQGHGVVEALFLCAEQQCHGARAGQFGQLRQRRRLLAQLLPVALPEFVPLCRVVIEPLAQFGAGRKLLQP